MDILKKIGVDWSDRRMISRLYIPQEAVVRVADGEAEPATIGKGMRQGCRLSQYCFRFMRGDDDRGNR